MLPSLQVLAVPHPLKPVVSNFGNVTANCFTDDIEVLSVVIHK